MKNPLHFCMLLLLLSTTVSAQLLVTGPSFPRDTSTVNITINVSHGNKGLLNYAQTNDVYVHIGAILGNDANAWDSVPFVWGTTPAAAKATYLGNNRYRYTISNIRSFFNVPSQVKIRKVALLLRNGDGTVVQRNADGSDMFFDLYDGRLTGRFAEPASEPTFNPAPGPIERSVGESYRFTYISNKISSLRLYAGGSEIAFEPSSTLVQESFTFNKPGNYQIIGRAESEGEIHADTLNVFIASATVVEPLPAGVDDGINYEEGDSSAILVLYAPGKSRVSVLGDFNDWTQTAAHQMKLTPDSLRFWTRITGLEPGRQYAFQYQVGNIRIADPYSELILDPVNDPFISTIKYPGLKPYPTGKTTGIAGVLQTGREAYDWEVTDFTRPRKEGLIIYELLLRDFLSTADWNTLKDTLGYLKRLGINAIELLPFNEFEGNISWGYNPSFYFTPDKFYGPADRLKAFIDACHKEGIAVIMDLALNHQFGQSPLVQMYFDASSGRPTADNPWFNPVPRHGFNVGYDMNHERQATKSFTGRVIRHWLTEYKIDGFRFDLSKGFTQNNTCDPNGENCDITTWSREDSGRIAIWKAYYDTVQQSSEGAYVILEHFAHNDEEKKLADHGMLLWGNLNHAFAEASMGWLQESDFRQGFARERGWNNRHLITYMESHDEERIVFKNINYGNSSGAYSVKQIGTALQRAELAATFFLMIPGPKMIWQFGEQGYDYSINYCENGTISPDCRTAPKPVKWDYLQQSSRKRLHELYTALLELRHHSLYSAVFTDGAASYKTDGAFKWIKLSTDTSDLVLIGNFDVTPLTVDISFTQAGTWYNYLTGATFNATGNAQQFTLQPGEYRLYVNRNITHILTSVRETDMLAASTYLTVYPNPASAESIISMEIPKSGIVGFSIRNAYGQQVGVADSRYRLKGRHQISLGALLKGSGVQQRGTYFVVMDYGGFRKTIQVIMGR